MLQTFSSLVGACVKLVCISLSVSLSLFLSLPVSVSLSECMVIYFIYIYIYMYSFKIITTYLDYIVLHVYSYFFPMFENINNNPFIFCFEQTSPVSSPLQSSTKPNWQNAYNFRFHPSISILFLCYYIVIMSSG